MNIKEQNGSVVIELKGKLTGGPVSELLDNTLDNFISKGKKNIVIDLSGIKFINSSGMGILISGYYKTKDNGGTLKLANITRKIEEILSITRLNQIFEIYNSVDEAVNSLK